jgi:hypothetical protein
MCIDTFNILCKELLPILRKLPKTERYAITIGGSFGKGLSDAHSDYDFRVYYDERAEGEGNKLIKDEILKITEKWNELGTKIDGVWGRSFADIDNKLELCLSGKAVSEEKVWCIWGYNLLTDIYNQSIIEDPFGIAEAWKKRLEVYPDSLRESLIKRHSSYLKYWYKDYHYKNKVNRRDIAFLSSLTARLVHEIMHLIYALNRFYYPGDGLNLIYTKKFIIKPENLDKRIEEILYPKITENVYEEQRQKLLELIEEVLRLI